MENKCIWILWDYSLWWAVVDSESAFGLLSVIMCPLYNDWKVLWDNLQILKLEILVSKLFPLCHGVCCGFVLFFSGQNVAQLHVGYSKYPKEQLQSFREDVILANHAHISLLWPSSAQNQTCRAVLLWWPLVKTEAAKSSLLSFKLGTSGLINYNFVIMLLGNVMLLEILVISL